MRKIFILFLFIISEAGAQTGVNDSAQIRHDYQPVAWNTSLRAEYYLKNGSYLFAEGLYKATKSYFYYSSESFKDYLWIGFEKKASEKWYIGVSGRLIQFRKDLSFVSRANLGHRGKISSLGFLKELSIDQISRKNKQNNVRVGFTMGLSKTIKAGKFKFLPVLSYKAVEVFDLKNPNSYLKNRRIDLTRLRLDIYFFVKNNLSLGVYAMRETDYYYVLGYSVPDPSNPSVILYSVPDYKVNSIIPTFGCSLNFLLNPDNNADIVPGLPLR